MRENETSSNLGARAAKALVLLALCLLAAATARAQWTAPDANNKISSTNAGVGVGTAAPNYKLEVAGSTSRNTVAVTGDGDGVGYAGIKIQAQTTAGIASNRISQFNLHMRKDGWYSGDTSGPSFIIETVSPSGGFAAPFMITPSNNVILNGGRGNSGLPYGWVGVGTTQPAANLHVNNAGGFAALRVSGAGGGLMQFYDTSAPADRKFYQWRSEGGLFRMALLNDSEGAWVQQNILVANSAGNVGLGTAAPTARLHVLGGNVFHQWSAAAGQEYGFYTAINNNHFTSNLAFDGQWKMISPGKGAIANVAPASGFAFLVGADNTPRAAGAPAAITQHFTVTMGGLVGVGTSTPAQRLDVAGNIKVTGAGNGVIFPDGTVQTTASAGGVSGVTAGIGLTGGGASGAPTIDIGVGTGLSAGADSISVNYGSAAGTAVQGNTTLTLAAGAGLSGGGTSTLGTGGTLTLANADRGSAQNIFKNVSDASGAVQFSAGSNSDSLSFEGAGGTTVIFNAAAKRVTINSSATVASGWTEAVGGASLSTTNTSARVGIGTPSPTHTLEVNGTINASGAITGGTIEARYQDVAEWVPSVQKLAAGTVVVLDAARENHVVASSSAYDTKVAGVVSESPGVILGTGGEGKLKVATTGRVRVKADARRGAIKVGDLLVTSGAEGVAMKSVPVDLGGTPIHRPGTIIGKALEPLESGTGEILVLLSLQ